MSWKKFLVHLVAITIGLLIAVGIEGLVELHREHKLVKEARQTIREEIEYNSQKMNDEIPSIAEQKSVMDANIQALTRVLENPKDKDAQHASLKASFEVVGLHDTAWKTAQATSALAYMPYDEAQRYADIYNAQQDFSKAEDQLEADDALLMGVLAKTDLGHDQVTPGMASLALERFGIWRMHLVYLDLFAKVSSASDKAFLEGKPAPSGMSEGLSSSGH